FLALPILGVKFFSRFQFSLPKGMTSFIVDEKNFRGKRMPFLMGAMTFFLPCGFTITAQGIALLAGRPLQASLIMLFFALGTLPALLLIGFSSLQLTQKPGQTDRFLKIAGVLILFFAVYNFNAQLNVLGLTSLSDISFKRIVTSASAQDLPPIVNGMQILEMDALTGSYEPDVLRVRAGLPVRWEITDKGTSGCTNAVISKNLFPGQIDLTPGQTSVKEFTPEKTGRYKFSCWMGMVVGTIVVVAEEGFSGSYDETQSSADFGSVGCSGGCTGSCGGGCGNTGCSFRPSEEL
ncbi:sulfite exporter TauE/SafE family protein, partial [Patescibacteria group bacterium]|nr:sulfite exporter TauE/SafE family protein [Patescibacteria group bacterium]